jgi:hypothetical protein
MADLELDDDSRVVTIEERLSILREILDRNPLTAKGNGQTQPSFQMNNYSGSPPDEVSDAKLIAMAKEMAESLPVLEGTAVDVPN